MGWDGRGPSEAAQRVIKTHTGLKTNSAMSPRKPCNMVRPRRKSFVNRRSHVCGRGEDGGGGDGGRLRVEEVAEERRGGGEGETGVVEREERAPAVVNSVVDVDVRIVGSSKVSSNVSFIVTSNVVVAVVVVVRAASRAAVGATDAVFLVLGDDDDNDDDDVTPKF